MDSLEKQSLILENRKTLTLNGVSFVESFTDNYVELSTNLGVVSVEGKDLKIESLNQDSGQIRIIGEISGFFYSESKSAKGFWQKIFK